MNKLCQPCVSPSVSNSYCFLSVPCGSSWKIWLNLAVFCCFEDCLLLCAALEGRVNQMQAILSQISERRDPQRIN